MEAITIKAYTTDNAEIEAITAVLKALKIKFELPNEKQYKPEFVAMVKKADKEFKAGKGVKMSVAKFKQLCK